MEAAKAQFLSEVGPLSIELAVVPQLVHGPTGGSCAACGTTGPTTVTLVYTQSEHASTDDEYVIEHVHRACAPEHVRFLAKKAKDELTVVLGVFMEDAINAWLGTRDEEAPAELKCEHCGTPVAKLVEDPYEADVHNTSGVMIAACGPCLGEIAADI